MAIHTCAQPLLEIAAVAVRRACPWPFCLGYSDWEVGKMQLELITNADQKVCPDLQARCAALLSLVCIKVNSSLIVSSSARGTSSMFCVEVVPCFVGYCSVALFGGILGRNSSISEALSIRQLCSHLLTERVVNLSHCSMGFCMCAYSCN